MFLETVWTWVLPIGLGLVLGLLISMRKNHDFSQIILLKPEDFRLNMRKGQLIDIRSHEAFEAKRINGSRNFEKMLLFASLHKIRKDQAIFLVDESNNLHVKKVSKKLIKKGYHPVYVLETGIEKYPFSLKEEN